MTISVQVIVPLKKFTKVKLHYLFSGGLAFITHQWWLNEAYGQLQASGMILWIIIIGVISTLVSPSGFLGVNFSDTTNVKKFSGYMIAVSLCAFIISYTFRGNRLFSKTIPFVGLFVGQAILKKKAEIPN